MSMPFTDLPGAYAWLDGQTNYERLLGQVVYNEQNFERDAFAQRLIALGNPQQGLRTIHIAGTRGKGSAALALERLLRAAGLSTAVYTSPHLREYRERVRINGDILPAADFVDLLGRIAAWRPASPPEQQIAFKTVFENLTALFFLAAKQHRVDWTIVETGLGGRLDATNVLEPGPVLLTRIGLEHTHLLGDTLTKIAGEKAAILKPGGWGVSGAQAPGGEAEAVFLHRSWETTAPLTQAPILCPVLNVHYHRDGQRIALEFQGKELSLDLPLFGVFQAENLQNALAMVDQLLQRGLIPHITPSQIQQALIEFSPPGRMERVCTSPEMFVDGGHCPTAAAALAAGMAAHFGEQPARLIVGMMTDKDHEHWFEEAMRWPGWSEIYCYQLESPRAVAVEKLFECAKKYGKPVNMFQNLKQVLDLLDQIDDKHSRTMASGSLYSVAAIEDWGIKHERTGKSQGQGSP